MRVGVYVDGFNLYYGGRSTFGKGTSGWKWLDLRALSNRLIADRSQWINATATRVVYCTAEIDGAGNPSGRFDQDVYIRALQAHSSIDHLELGYYVTRLKRGALARRGTGSSFVHVDLKGNDIVPPQTPRIVSVAQREEKGSGLPSPRLTPRM